MYLKDNKWSLSQNQRVRTDFLVIDGTRHWLSISNLFQKVKSERTPDITRQTPVPVRRVDVRRANVRRVPASARQKSGARHQTLVLFKVKGRQSPDYFSILLTLHFNMVNLLNFNLDTGHASCLSLLIGLGSIFVDVVSINGLI